MVIVVRALAPERGEGGQTAPAQDGQDGSLVAKEPPTSAGVCLSGAASRAPVSLGGDVRGVVFCVLEARLPGLRVRTRFPVAAAAVRGAYDGYVSGRVKDDGRRYSWG